MRWMDRWVFGDSREWACGRARGEVLEVAVGTGLNLALYSPDTEITGLTGIDVSDAMLALARDKATALGLAVTLRQADAHALPFDDASFDTVVCTLGLCAIPGITRAVGEMRRVLRPDGRLILVDHVAGMSWPVRAVQWALETASVPIAGEHFRRRPHDDVLAAGFTIERAERFGFGGVVERLVARAPDTR